jgi:hypothetical protein
MPSAAGVLARALAERQRVGFDIAVGASAPLDPDPEERAIYVVEGEVDIAGETFATRPAHQGPRYIWWNFVSSHRERIEQAKEDWKTGKLIAKNLPIPSFACRNPERGLRAIDAQRTGKRPSAAARAIILPLLSKASSVPDIALKYACRRAGPM